MYEMADPFSERAVIAGVIKHGHEIYYDVFDVIDVDSFSIESNQVIWKCIHRIFEQDAESRIDIPTIVAAAQSLNLFEYIEKNKEHLRSIIQTNVEASNVRKLAVKVRKLWIIRNMYDRVGSVQSSLLDLTGDEPLDRIHSIVEAPVIQLADVLYTDKKATIRKLGDNALEYVEHLKNNPSEIVGIDTGYKLYNRALGGGFRRKSMHIIAARSGVGKSLIADNIGTYVAGTLGIPVLNVDTEMDDTEHLNRVFAMLSGIPITEVAHGRFSGNEIRTRKIVRAAKRVANMPYYYIDVSNNTFEETLAFMRRWVHKVVGRNEYGLTNDCLIIYDYIHLLSSDQLSKSMQEYQLLGLHSSQLHGFTHQYDLPMLVLSQTNRDGIEKEDQSVIAGADRVVHYASSVSIYKEKTADEIEQDGPHNGNRKLRILKTRFGQKLSPGDYISMAAHPDTGKIEEVMTHFQIQRMNKDGDDDTIDVEEDDEQIELD